MFLNEIKDYVANWEMVQGIKLARVLDLCSLENFSSVK
jgi:hypothetical protein